MLRVHRIAILHGAALPSPAASTVQIMKMAAAFAAEGKTVCLFVPDRPDRDTRIGDVFTHYGVEPSFTIRRSFWPRTPGRAFLSAMHMAVLVQRFKPDIVYARFSLGAYACALTGLPVIFEAHRPPSQLSPLERWALLRLLTHPRLEALVVISAALRDLFRKEVPSFSGNVTVAHDGADLMQGEPMRGESDEPVCAGYIGSLYAGRGIELILELARLCPEVRFELIGGSAAEVARWSRAAEQAGARNIYFRGFLPHPMAQLRFRGFNILLAPYGKRVSIHGDASADTSAFMSPLKLFEYMAAGRAIVCSDHPVLAEVIVPNETAIVCRRDAPEEWAAAVRALAADPERRARLGCAARQSLALHYTWRARCRRILTECLRVAKRAAG